jgi:RNA polymerase sigma-54 factor
MAITTKLELRQTHSLVMTPQLQQAIKLLQLSNMELATFVETELERNPLLERADSEETVSPAEPTVEPVAAATKEAGEQDGSGSSAETRQGDGEV